MYKILYTYVYKITYKIYIYNTCPSLLYTFINIYILYRIKQNIWAFLFPVKDFNLIKCKDTLRESNLKWVLSTSP